MTNPKHYYRPQTLAEAIERAARPGSIALSGGALTLRGLSFPFETVVDLQDVAELKTVERLENMLLLGGALPLQAAFDHADLPVALRDSLTRALTPHLRHGTSIAESLTHRNPPREWVAGLIALGASMEHAGRLDALGETEFWNEPLDEFVRFHHDHGQPYRGIVKALHVPLPDNHTALQAAYVARSPADAPIVNVAVRVMTHNGGDVQQAVAGFGGVSDFPVIRVELPTLVGKPLSQKTIDETAEMIDGKLNHPPGDYKGSSMYRREMAFVLVKRALTACMEQLQT